MKCEVCGGFQPCPEYYVPPILCKECMYSTSTIMQREIHFGRETHLRNFLKIKNMPTFHKFKPLKMVYQQLSQVFSEFTPEKQGNIEDFHAILKFENSITHFPKIDNRFILFNNKSKHLGIAYCSIKTDLTLISSSDEIEAALKKLYGFYHKKISMSVYRNLKVLQLK